uniref:Uncharacterized protein n=1 Tax=Sphaerodactylus townsendi TaxID=933632 RepID=A0ACB8G5X9_9SAUR
MISRSVQFEENEMAMSPEGHTMTRPQAQQDWLMYPVANDAQRDDSLDLDDNQDVLDEPEEIPDVDVEPEYLPIPAAAAEGEEIPRDEVPNLVLEQVLQKNLYERYCLCGFRICTFDRLARLPTHSF